MSKNKQLDKAIYKALQFIDTMLALVNVNTKLAPAFNQRRVVATADLAKDRARF